MKNKNMRNKLLKIVSFLFIFIFLVILSTMLPLSNLLIAIGVASISSFFCIKKMLNNKKNNQSINTDDDEYFRPLKRVFDDRDKPLEVRKYNIALDKQRVYTRENESKCITLDDFYDRAKFFITNTQYSYRVNSSITDVELEIFADCLYNFFFENKRIDILEDKMKMIIELTFLDAIVAKKEDITIFDLINNTRWLDTSYKKKKVSELINQLYLKVNNNKIIDFQVAKKRILKRTTYSD